MAYNKTNWVNGQAPALSAENLNKMENGIFDNDNKISALEDWANAPIVVREFTSNSVSINAGAAAGASIPFTAPTGYKTLCPVYSRTNGDVFANYPAALTQGLTSGTTTVYIRNTASSAVSVSATIGIMFIKS